MEDTLGKSGGACELASAESKPWETMKSGTMCVRLRARPPSREVTQIKRGAGPLQGPSRELVTSLGSVHRPTPAGVHSN